MTRLQEYAKLTRVRESAIFNLLVVLLPSLIVGVGLLVTALHGTYWQIIVGAPLSMFGLGGVIYEIDLIRVCNKNRVELLTRENLESNE